MCTEAVTTTSGGTSFSSICVVSWADAAQAGEHAAGAHRGQCRPAGRDAPATPVTPRYPGPVERVPDDARRRRIAIALVALAVVLFILELVAIAVGLLEVAALIFVIFVGGWFALRSYQRRTGGA